MATKKSAYVSLFPSDFLGEEMSDFTSHRVVGFDEKKKIIDGWTRELASGKLDESKEEEIKPRFLIDVFGKILGYNLNDPTEWSLKQEMKTVVDSTKADAGLGIFELRDTDERMQVFAVIEIKDSNTNLDHKPNSGVSAVQQGFDYALKTAAKWVIVSNFKETRLYRASFVGAYELFELEKLTNESELLKFIFLLEKTGLIHTQKSRLEKLFVRSEFYSPRRHKQRKGKEPHIIDQLVKALESFDGLTYIAPEIISNLPPFTVLNEYVWHTEEYTLFSLNKEIFHLLQNITISEQGVVSFDRNMKQR